MSETIRIPAISVRGPGKKARDARFAVTMHEDGTPWPLVFYFLMIRDDETGETTWPNVGFEVGGPFKVEPGSALEVEPEPIDALALQRIAGNYALYIRFAREALTFNRAGMAGAVKMLRVAGRTRRGLSDDFYRLIGSEYEARKQAGGHPIKEMAAAHHADKSTVSRWVKAARTRGFIAV